MSDTNYLDEIICKYLSDLKIHPTTLGYKVLFERVKEECCLLNDIEYVSFIEKVGGQIDD